MKRKDKKKLGTIDVAKNRLNNVHNLVSVFLYNDTKFRHILL